MKRIPTFAALFALFLFAAGVVPTSGCGPLDTCDTRANTAAFDCQGVTCGAGEYCRLQGCGVPGCTPPPPVCEPLPGDCGTCQAVADQPASSGCACSDTQSGVVILDCPGA